MIRKCCISDCRRRTRNESLRVFKFPAHKDTKLIWASKCQVDLNKLNPMLYVCSKHFEKKFLGRGRLLKGAIPMLNLPSTSTPRNNNNNNNNSNISDNLMNEEYHEVMSDIITIEEEVDDDDDDDHGVMADIITIEGDDEVMSDKLIIIEEDNEVMKMTSDFITIEEDHETMSSDNLVIEIPEEDHYEEVMNDRICNDDISENNSHCENLESTKQNTESVKIIPCAGAAAAAEATTAEETEQCCNNCLKRKETEQYYKQKYNDYEKKYEKMFFKYSHYCKSINKIKGQCVREKIQQKRKNNDKINQK